MLSVVRQRFDVEGKGGSWLLEVAEPFVKGLRKPFVKKKSLLNLVNGDVQQCPSMALVSATPCNDGGVCHTWSTWDAADGEGCDTDEKVCPSLHQVMSTPFEDRWRVWDSGGDSDYCEVKHPNGWMPNRVKHITMPGKVRASNLPQYVRAIGPIEFAGYVSKVYARDLAAGVLGESRQSMRCSPLPPAPGRCMPLSVHMPELCGSSRAITGVRRKMSDWMSELKPLLEAAQTTLLQLTLPGSHDVMTYGLSERVSVFDQVKMKVRAEDCQNAWQEWFDIPGSFADKGSPFTVDDVLCLACPSLEGVNVMSGNGGDAMGVSHSFTTAECSAFFSSVQDLMGRSGDCSYSSFLTFELRNPLCGARAQAAAQGATILEQLDGGVRFLDMRIDYQTVMNGGPGWYAVHTSLSNRPAMYYFAQLKAWMDNHPDEIVVMWLTRHGDCGDPQGRTMIEDDQFPGTTEEIRRQFWNEFVDLFGVEEDGGLLFDASSRKLSATKITDLMGNGRLIVYIADYVSMTGSSKYAINCVNNGRELPDGQNTAPNTNGVDNQPYFNAKQGDGKPVESMRNRMKQFAKGEGENRNNNNFIHQSMSAKPPTKSAPEMVLQIFGNGVRTKREFDEVMGGMFSIGQANIGQTFFGQTNIGQWANKYSTKNSFMHLPFHSYPQWFQDMFWKYMFTCVEDQDPPSHRDFVPAPGSSLIQAVHQACVKCNKFDFLDGREADGICTQSLLENAQLLNYYNAQALERTYQDMKKSFDADPTNDPTTFATFGAPSVPNVSADQLMASMRCDQLP